MRKLAAPAVVSVFAAIAMMSCFSFAAWADESNEILAANMGSSLTIQESVLDSGTCGSNLTWSLSSLYVLTVRGTGDMTNWNPNALTPTTAPWYQYRERIKSVTIEDGVTSIGSFAFNYCPSLKTVTIPASVVSIGEYAFSSCESLSSANVASSVKSIGDYAFAKCVSLPSFSIPASATSIGQGAFDHCASLTSVTIPDSVASIGDYAFRECTSLTSAAISPSMTKIGYYVFGNCTSLSSVTIPASITEIGSFAFRGCTSLASVEIPSSVVTIGDSSFKNCTSLVTISIPESVTSLEGGAFSGCSSLRSVNIPESVSRITVHLFNGCSSLSSLVIPPSVTAIEMEAFNCCASLKYISVPSSVMSVGDGAFLDLAEQSRIFVATQSQHDLLAGDSRYVSPSKTSVLVGLAKITSVALSDSSYTYDGGEKKPLVTVTASAGGETFTIASKKSESTDSFSLSYAQGRKDAGMYDVSVEGSGCFSGKATGSFTIDPAPISSVKLSNASYAYDGEEKKPAVSVYATLGGKEAAIATGETSSTSDFTLAYASGRKDAGKYKVTVSGKGNYIGTKTETFTVSPAPIDSVKLSNASYVFNGGEKKPAVSVYATLGGKKTVIASMKTSSTGDFTLVYASGRKNAGSYDVTVTGKGNYTGTKTATFTVQKASQKVTAKKASLTKQFNKAKSGKYKGKLAKTKTLDVKKSLSLKANTGAALTIKVSSVPKAAKKFFSMNRKSGKLTVKKGLKKGSYTLKIVAAAKSSTNYKPASKTVSVRVKVR